MRRIFLSTAVALALFYGAEKPSRAAGNDEAVRSITAALRAGQFQQALELAKTAERNDPKDVRVFVLEGMALTRLGKDGDALAVLEKATALAPDYIPALEAAAEIEYREGKPQAAAHLQRLLELRPGEQTAHAMLGALAYKQSDCASAVRHFGEAKSAFAKQPDALREYGACLLKLKRPGDAADIFRQLVELSPDDRRARYSLAIALMDATRFRDAIAALEPLTVAATPDPVALELSASAHESLGETPEAAAQLRNAIVADPRNVDLYLDFANLSFTHQSFQVGIDMIAAGLKLMPEAAPLYLARGVLHVQLAEYAKADADFDQAEQLKPNQSLGSVARGLSQIQQNNLEEALATVRTQLKTNPKDAFLHYVLAELLSRQGAQAGSPQFRQAVAAASEAVRLKPDFALARDVLSRLYLQEGEADKAIDQCRLALRDNPEDEMALYRLIRALQSSGRADAAAEVPDLLKRFGILREKLRAREAEAGKYRLVEEPGKPNGK